MKCERCGMINVDGANFCASCGNRLIQPPSMNDVKAGDIRVSTQNPSNVPIQNPSGGVTQNPSNVTAGKNKKTVIIIVSVLLTVVAAVILILLLSNNKSDKDDRTANDMTENTARDKDRSTETVSSEHTEEGTSDTGDKTEDIDNSDDEGMKIRDEDLAEYGLDSDVEAYYQENSTVISSFKADESEVVFTEKDAVEKLTELEFDQYAVEYNYTIDGLFFSEAKEASDSENKRPMYQTYYVDKNENVWTIYLINDRVMAYPVSYNIQSEASAPVVFSEKESVVSYDCVTNKFYETIPNETELIVVNAGTINKDLLDKMTIEEIDKYVKK